MPQIVKEIWLPAAPAEVWDRHSTAEALVDLSPDANKLKLLLPEAHVAEDAIHRFRVHILGIPFLWEAKITEVSRPLQFRDTAQRSIFAHWSHLHEFIPERGGTLLRDTVDYTPPLGFLGKIADNLFIRRMLESMWRHRHQVLQRWFTKET